MYSLVNEEHDARHYGDLVSCIMLLVGQNDKDKAQVAKPDMIHPQRPNGQTVPLQWLHNGHE